MTNKPKLVASTSERLKYAFTQSKLKQVDLVKKTGIDKSSISLYLSGKVTPKGQKLYKIASALGCDPVWLSGFDVEMNPTKNKKRNLIPVLGDVPAGIPIEAVEDIIDYEEISEEMARAGEYFALRIRGDSMEPRFKEGDVVIVRKQEAVDNGQVAVVMVNGDDATVKKFYKTAAGVMLVGNNPTFTPLNYTPEQVEQLPVRVIGRVVELRAKF